MNYIASDLKVVGTRPIRPDGVDKVTGRALFAANTRAAGMLWGKIKRSPHAHANIVRRTVPRPITAPVIRTSGVLTAVSRPVEPGTVHSVDTWNMAQAEIGQELILTLCTPEGLTISYIIKPLQLQGMATVAAYGATRGAAIRSIH